MAHCATCGHSEKVHYLSQDENLTIYNGKCDECDCEYFDICECVVCNYVGD